MEAHECPADRKCPGCGTVKPQTDFFFDKSTGRRVSRCKDCTNEYNRQRYQKSKDKKLKACAEYRKANQEKVKASLADWYKRNKAHVLERCKEYNARPEVRAREAERQKLRYASNRDVIQQKRKDYYKQNPDAVAQRDARLSRYYEKNRAKFAAKSLKRLALKLRAVPPWADERAIVAFYKEAAERTVATGVAHEVDHIIPLQGRNVCGLHVETNLRVITAFENRSKGNKHTA